MYYSVKGLALIKRA